MSRSVRLFALQAALVALLYGFLWEPGLVPLAAVAALLTGLWAAVAPRERHATPTAITRMPTVYEKERKPRRWGWALGIGLTPMGPLPFLSIFRRRRPW